MVMIGADVFQQFDSVPNHVKWSACNHFQFEMMDGTYPTRMVGFEISPAQDWLVVGHWWRINKEERRVVTMSPSRRTVEMCDRDQLVIDTTPGFKQESERRDRRGSRMHGRRSDLGYSGTFISDWSSSSGWNELFISDRNQRARPHWLDQ